MRLRDEFKLFEKIEGKMMSLKDEQDLNIMVYKKRDALKYVLSEYEALREHVEKIHLNLPDIEVPK